jgi:hypothetical protein
MDTRLSSRRNFLAAAASIPALFVTGPDGDVTRAEPLMPHGPTGQRYRDGIIDRIDLVRKANDDVLNTIADIGANAHVSGKSLWAYMHAGHTHNADNFAGRHGLPKLFNPLAQVAEFEDIGEGDLLVCSSGDNPEMPAVIKEKKATLVSWTFPYGGDAHGLFERMVPDRADRLYSVRLGQYADHMIDTFQLTDDGTIEISGIRAKFGAQSGPLVMSMFWMITLRIIERLAARGIQLDVY